MTEYLLKIEVVAGNLIAIGENITKQDRILYLLARLGSEIILLSFQSIIGHQLND